MTKLEKGLELEEPWAIEEYGNRTGLTLFLRIIAGIGFILYVLQSEGWRVW
jgi:hypothetical protein